jgi:hypothetical protein
MVENMATTSSPPPPSTLPQGPTYIEGPPRLREINRKLSVSILLGSILEGLQAKETEMVRYEIFPRAVLRSLNDRSVKRIQGSDLFCIGLS